MVVRYEQEKFGKNIFSNVPPYLTYFIFLVFLSITTIILDHKYNKLESVRTVLSTALYPIYFIHDVPLDFFSWLRNHSATIDEILEQKTQLVEKNLLLSEKIQKFMLLEVENQRLRNLLNMSQQYQHEKVQIASVMALENNKNPNELTLDKGRKDGVYLGQTVLDDSGLLGRIIHVSYNQSKLLLITSPKHYTPVQIAKISYRSTVVGKGFFEPLQLLRVSENAKIKVGDTLITSGIGGVFPKGYKVGVIEHIESKPGHSLQVRVAPFSKSSKVQEVLLIWPQKNPDNHISQKYDSKK